ncbi:MAG: hypothetical protein AAF349_00335 [Cyanobacteria bacterium P01_A01_bin.68]
MSAKYCREKNVCSLHTCFLKENPCLMPCCFTQEEYETRFEELEESEQDYIIRYAKSYGIKSREYWGMTDNQLEKLEAEIFAE